MRGSFNDASYECLGVSVMSDDGLEMAYKYLNINSSSAIVFLSSLVDCDFLPLEDNLNRVYAQKDGFYSDSPD
jgi:hypothetical protein